MLKYTSEFQIMKIVIHHYYQKVVLRQFLNLNAFSSQNYPVYISPTYYHIIVYRYNGQISSQKETVNNEHVSFPQDTYIGTQKHRPCRKSKKKEKLNLFLYCTYSYISRSIFEEDLDLLLFFSNLSKLMSSFSSFGGT